MQHEFHHGAVFVHSYALQFPCFEIRLLVVAQREVTEYRKTHIHGNDVP